MGGGLLVFEVVWPVEGGGFFVVVIKREVAVNVDDSYDLFGE